MNPVQAQNRAAMNAEIARLPPAVRAQIVADGLAEARSVLPVPYWSTVRVAGTVAANALTVDTSVRKAFQYQIGQAMDVAGRAGVAAQYCDTNLLRAGETLDGADVYIWGLCIELCSNGADPRLAGEVWRDSSVTLSFNGTQSIQVGTLSMFPSAGGLYGVGNSNLVLPTIATTGIGDSGPGSQFGYICNGNPMAGNFLKFPQPFKWAATGGPDAQLSVNITPNRTITIPLAATRAAAAGIGQYTQPVTGAYGTFIDLRVRLVSTSVARRSTNL